MRNEGRFFYSNSFQFLRICKELAKYTCSGDTYTKTLFFIHITKKIKKYFADIKNNYIFAMSMNDKPTGRVAGTKI